MIIIRCPCVVNSPNACWGRLGGDSTQLGPSLEVFQRENLLLIDLHYCHRGDGEELRGPAKTVTRIWNNNLGEDSLHSSVVKNSGPTQVTILRTEKEEATNL